MKWTEEQMEYLRNNYADMTAKQIAENLGLTMYQVQNKARSLGLKKGNTAQVAAGLKSFTEACDSLNLKILGTYKNAKTRILVECSLGHQWETLPTNQVSHGHGCNICNTGSVHSGPGHLYVMQVGEYLKIGVTTDVDRRTKQVASESGMSVEVLYSEYLKDAYAKEKQVQDHFARYRTRSEKKFRGYTELFKEVTLEDILCRVIS